MSPMWLTSKTPTAPRTALCSATSPPVEGYSTGMSHPPKLTIFAPNRRCSALSGVFRSSLVGELTDSIPHAQAETDTSTRYNVRQRSAPRAQNGVFRLAEWDLGGVAVAARPESVLPPNARSGKVFKEACYARSHRLLHVRQNGR